MTVRASLAALIAIAATTAASAAPLDAVTINRIADQSFNHSQVMQTAAHLTDQIGGRLANSPAARKAEAWTQSQFKDWGLSNVHAEGFEFGRGWWIEDASVKMTAPRPLMLRSIPIAWTPPTNGALSALVIVAPMAKERDFAAWKGKLAGKIVLVSYPPPPADDTAPMFRRNTAEDIAKLDVVQQSDLDPTERARYETRAFPRKLDRFLKAEGAVAWARMSIRPNGLVHGEGYLYRVGDTASLPAVELAQEDYRRLARLAKVGPVSLSINSNVHGRRASGQLVAADGATDNAAGSAVIMEAARILKAIGTKPKRTIRFALWAAEEEGIHGSDAYVRAHLATRPRQPDPDLDALGPWYNSKTFPITKLAGYGDLAGYFNIDNGSGNLRGLYAEGNFAAVPMLKDWLSPFAGFGAASVVASKTAGTDHVYMQTVGLPGFQFIQDPLDYGSRTHHSSVDAYDHLRPEDLRQAAVILASVLLSAANAENPIPAATLPTEPVDNDPFRYRNPALD